MNEIEELVFTLGYDVALLFHYMCQHIYKTLRRTLRFAQGSAQRLDGRD